MTGTPLVSVLLTSWNTRELTLACVASLHRALAGLPAEIIVVDNGSADGSAAALVADPGLTLISNPVNRGFAAAMNQAQRAATGELLMIINSDVIMAPTALSLMIDFLADRPEVAGVSPHLHHPDGRFQHHFAVQPSLAVALGLYTALRRLPGFSRARERYDLRGVDFSMPQPYASASCLLLRAAVVPGALFDEEFPVFWNDVWLFRRLGQRRRTCWTIPGSVAVHARGSSCVRLGSRARFRHLLGGLVRYLQRTQRPAAVRVFRLAMITDYLAKSITGRRTPLGWRDLRAALRGDVGPLPDGDTRPWDVIVDGAATADRGRRQLVVELGTRGGFSVVQETADRWRARVPALVPALSRLPGWRRLELRVTGARLRSWLDGQAGPRSVHAGPTHAPLARWLGEDVDLIAPPLGVAA